MQPRGCASPCAHGRQTGICAAGLNEQWERVRPRRFFLRIVDFPSKKKLAERLMVSAKTPSPWPRPHNISDPYLLGPVLRALKRVRDASGDLSPVERLCPERYRDEFARLAPGLAGPDGMPHLWLGPLVAVVVFLENVTRRRREFQMHAGFRLQRANHSQQISVVGFPFGPKLPKWQP